MHFRPVDHPDDDAYVTHGSEGPRLEMGNDHFDDVFGSGEDDEHVESASHPSDMRRLEAEHATAGYREGVNVGKQATLQRGFDEGYTMGAAIGLQAGQILGVLEGIAEALRGNDEVGWIQASKLATEAQEDLSVEKLFNKDYWTPSGEPSYDVGEDQLQSKEGGFAHPLIQKWLSVLEQKLQLWNIDRAVLDHIKPDVEERPAEEPQEQHGQQPVAKDPLDW